MTKEQFLKMYGQPNTVVSFKNDAEKMEFLKECEKHGIRWQDGERATEWIPRQNVINLEGGKNMTSDDARYNMEMGHKFIAYVPVAPSPKSLIKDGWMGVQRTGKKVWFLPYIGGYVYASQNCYPISQNYTDELNNGGSEDIMELYDNLGNLQWKREEKSAKDIEIERIQAEIDNTCAKLLSLSKEYNDKVKQLADDLSKLKGE